MKKKLAFLTLSLFMSISLFGKKSVVYSTDGTKIQYEKIYTEITLGKGTPVTLKKGDQVGGIGVLMIASEGVKVALNLTTALLQEEQKKYTTEYSGNKVITAPEYNKLPEITITRKFIPTGKKKEPIVAYKLVLAPQKPIWVDGTVKVGDENLLYYRIESLDFFYSEAKTTKKDPYTDFGVELGLVYISGKGDKRKVKTATSGIMVVPYLKPKDVGIPQMGNLESNYIYGSELILLEIKYKIVQTNANKTPFDKLIAVLEGITDSTGDLLGKISDVVKEGAGE